MRRSPFRSARLGTPGTQGGGRGAVTTRRSALVEVNDDLIALRGVTGALSPSNPYSTSPTTN